jgi:hypothetical protein
MRKNIFYIFILLSFFFLIFCCTDIFNSAYKKSISNDLDYYDQEVSGLNISQGADYREAVLNWENPVDVNFSAIKVLRKSGDTPVSYDDPSADQVYSGTGNSFTDSNLTPNSIFYYAVFAKNKEGKYSGGRRGSKEILSDNTPDTIVYPEDVTNFVSVVGSASVFLSWTNPTELIFNNVRLLRKTGGYPSAYNDSSSLIVYEGTDDSCLDTAVVSTTKYYYSIYTKSTGNVYSQYPLKTYKTVVTFNKTVRDRCFYFIGGSSNYTTDSATFSNLITEIDAFDPVTETVYPNIASIPTPRYSCAAASEGGKIYIFGGLDLNKNAVDTVEILDIGSSIWPDSVWSTGTDMPLPRFSLRAENINGNIYVFGGSTSILPYAYLYMSNKVHKYSPDYASWTIDENQVPLLAYKYMNIASGAQDGIIYYGYGRYSTQNGFLRYTNALNPLSMYTYTFDDVDAQAVASSAGVAYFKDLPSSEDILYFISIGGSTNTGSAYEPLRGAGGINLTATNLCFYTRFPNTGGGIPNVLPVGKNLNTSRAYCEGEYYGNYVYVFCGVDNGGTVLNTTEKLYIDNSGTFPSNWQAVSTSGLKQRYGFDITKVIY